MTISAVLDRITQIQSQMQQLSTFDQTSAASGSSFSSQLDNAVSSASGATGASSTDGSSAATSSAAMSPAAAATSAGAVPADFGTAPATATQQAVIDDAKKYLGVPYLWGGTDPSKGLDCSGLVQRVYGDLGIQLPRVASDQAQVGTEVASLADAQPGDLLAFGSPVHHIGIYAGNGEMIEAPHTGDHVKIIKVADFGEPVTHIRRVLPSTTTGPSTASLQDSLAASRATYLASNLAGAVS